MKTLALVIAFVAVFLTGLAIAAPPGAVPATRHEAKPTGPIAVDVRLAAPPALGVPFTVIVTARAESVGRLELEVHTDDPAALAIVAESAPVDGTGVRSWQVTVTPTRASGGNLGVLVTGEIDGVTQARSVVTPIRLAEAAPASHAQSLAAPKAGSENLSLLPVEERSQAPK
jgi:hypothetical protein